MMADNERLVKFTPDLEGTYVLQIADGATTAQITINAGTYVGYDSGVTASCITCHSGKVTEWEGTGHSDMLVRGLEGTASDHYGEGCISCHTTGYDLDADNNGFDDHPFVFPDTLMTGMYDSMVTTFPEAMKFANIQCESCHGPGSAHVGNTADEKMVASLDDKNCASCHDEGTHHVFPEQYKYSVHANPTTLARGGSASCAPCHSGSGYVAWIKNGKNTLTDVPEPYKISCAVCHDPHSVENEHQLRSVEDVVLGNGQTISGGGNGNLCMDCHKGRRNVADYTGPDFSYSSHFGPHHGPQADLLAGGNLATFGKKLPSSPHLTAVDNSCVGCHMAAGDVMLVGSHTFSMVDTAGNDNVASCEGCHGDVGTTFAEKKYYFNGMADHDGDGVAEGLQHEVEGLLEELAMALPPVGVNEVDMGGTYEYSVSEVKAAFNWFAVEEDRSLGIHNPAYTVAVMKLSIAAVENNAVEGGIVAIDDVPNDQGKQVKIIWNKFIDDGVAADPTVAYKVKRNDGDANVWTDVAGTKADGSDRYALVVPTLYDSTADNAAMTSFKVYAISASGNVHMSDAVDGYSLDNLVPMAPKNPTTSIAEGTGVNITWEETADLDVNYYAVYRSTTQNFTPDESNRIGTTTDLKLVDAIVDEGTYYYKINAVDFSGNEGNFSTEVNAVISGISEGNQPLSYRLEANYPNPFNPSTTIDFSIKNSGHVSLVVYNTVGQAVYTLMDKAMDAGTYSTTFHANGFSSGTYFYRLTVVNSSAAVEYQQIQKMLLLK